MKGGRLTLVIWLCQLGVMVPTALAVQSANSVATVGTANAWPLTPPTFDTSLPRRALINGPLVVLGNYQNGNDNQNGDSNQQTSNSNTNLTGNGSSVISNANGATTDMSHSNNQQLNQGQQDQRSSHRETQAPLRNLTGEQDSQPQTVEETPAVPAVRPLPPPSPQQQQPATPFGPEPVRAGTQPQLDVAQSQASNQQNTQNAEQVSEAGAPQQQSMQQTNTRESTQNTMARPAPANGIAPTAKQHSSVPSNEQQVDQKEQQRRPRPGSLPLAPAISTAPQVIQGVLPNGLAEAGPLPVNVRKPLRLVKTRRSQKA